MEKQRTIKRSVKLEGIGIHSGEPTTIIFHPTTANYGYKFVRSDLSEPVEIPALVDYVVDLSRGTTIGIGDVRVLTVEHVLAALVGLQIDNCKIELFGKEPPVIDGSSLAYAQKLLEAGIVEQDTERKYFVIDETVRYTNEEKGVDIVALPTDDYRITVMIDYNLPALGSQHTGVFNLEKEFLTEFAPARTFCFLSEVEELSKQGLIKGGSLENALVIIDKEVDEEELKYLGNLFKLNYVPKLGQNGILNETPLRFKNEPARHKLLDMLGDLALIGVPIKAQILAARPGHYSNIEFAKKIRSLYLKKLPFLKLKSKRGKEVLMDIFSLLKIMPHRYPFLLVDRIIGIDTEANTIVGVKNVTINEPFFVGHFPEKPVMPGVLLIEAMAQTGGLMLLNSVDASNKLLLFMGIDNAKFRKPVIPGDQLIIKVQQTGKKFNTYRFHGEILVNEQVVAETDMQAALVDRNVEF